MNNDMNNYNNFFESNESTQTQQPQPQVPEYTPEPQPKKAKRHGGMIVGILAASLVLGTASGFGGSALYNALSKDSSQASAQAGTQFPGNPEQGFGQRPEFGQMPGQGEMPEQGQMPGSEQQEEDESSEIGNGVFPFNKKNEEKKDTETSSTTDQNAGAQLTISTASNGQSLSTEEIASVAAPSVVEISTEYVKTGNFMQQYVSSGAGSGVIISEDGYIITNNHVIEDATQIKVTTIDGTTYDAVLVGRDDQLDVALLKVEASGLTVASFGDSDQVNLGEKVVAIGNPLGQLGGTVTEGIISSLNREITIDNQSMTLMQTDAAINPGNSGGGLFNDQGQIIGLVVAKSAGEDIEGIGFAIPINNVQAILNDLLNYGYTKGKAYLGVYLLDITSEQMARMYNVSETGTYVYSVAENSAAEKAGLKSGDLIYTINGKEITCSDDVKASVEEAGVGNTLVFSISRNGQSMEIEVEVGEYIPDLMPTQMERSDS